MGKQTQLAYIENIAATLMGQLEITDDDVGVDTYAHDQISGRIRQKLHKRVFCDIRRMKVETLARIISVGALSHPASPHEQASDPLWTELQKGNTRCTLNHVWYPTKSWLSCTEELTSVSDIMRHCAATAIVAAMYDIVVSKRLAKPKAP